MMPPRRHHGTRRIRAHLRRTTALYSGDAVAMIIQLFPPGGYLGPVAIVRVAYGRRS